MAFIVFCIYLKWQPWQNRLLLPLIILWSPLVAVVIAEMKQAWATNTILIAMCVAALPLLLFNTSRPLISKRNTESIITSERISQYFTNKPKLMQDYYEIVQRLKNNNCSNVAIQIGVDTWEYPLWVLLQREFGRNIRIEHVNVDNVSGKIPFKNFNYCETVSIGR
jgi:hypothetical protein